MEPPCRRSQFSENVCLLFVCCNRFPSFLRAPSARVLYFLRDSSSCLDDVSLVIFEICDRGTQCSPDGLCKQWTSVDLSATLEDSLAGVLYDMFLSKFKREKW